MIPFEYSCGPCAGEGRIWVQVGPEDSEQDICDECNGTGIQIPEILNLPVAEMDPDDYPSDVEEEVPVHA